MGEIIALSRHLGDKNFEMHKSIWKKVDDDYYLNFMIYF